MYEFYANKLKKGEAKMKKRDEIVAIKMWTREDIASILREKGFKDTDDNIDMVVNTGMLSSLNDCTDDDWEIISNAIHEVANPMEKQLTGSTMTFESPEQMLSVIQSGIDLYNVFTEEYVFVYNEEGSIAVYSIDLDGALELEKKSKESGEYWGAFLGIGGAIWDDPEHDDYVEGSSNMDFCKEAYKEKGWIDVTPYKEKEAEKSEIYTFEVYDCDNLDDYGTFDDSEFCVKFTISSEDVISKFQFLLSLFEGCKYRLLNESGISIISGAFDPNDIDDIRLIKKQ